MQLWRVLVAAVVVSASGTAGAADRPDSSPEQFASATKTCFDALAAKDPADVLTVIQANGWKIQQTTPIGGVFRQDGTSMLLKVETVLFSRICTVLGNRDRTIPLPEMSRLIEAGLKVSYGNDIKHDETSSAFTLIAKEKYRAVITPQQSGNDFNTQITTIDI